MDKNQKTAYSHSALKFILELAKIIFISLAIIIPIRYFLIQPFYVRGASMEPSFYDHEYLIINEISYRFSEPERGNIIVFKYPLDPRQYFIKRIIGLPGEKIEIDDGKVRIYNHKCPQGVVLDESAYLFPGTRTSGETKILLHEDEYFVLGDNRNSSLDSRSFGSVPKENIIGKVWLRGWPINRITNFGESAYNF